MRNKNTNELTRAVSLLNFEQENRDKAQKVLIKKYNIPQFYISLIVHKIFNKIGTYDFTLSNKKSPSFWDQFHQFASEEVKSFSIQN